MKRQIIELEDGSKWVFADKDPYSFPSNPNSVQRAFMFERLPPPNPMPELKTGYSVCINDGTRLFVLVRPRIDGNWHVVDRDYVDTRGIDTSTISEIHCPHRGLIWKGE